MDDIQSWIKVITDPLGLAGFALFLVFGVLAKAGFSKSKKWVAVSAFSMAFVALIGGLFLSWNKNLPNKIDQPANSTKTDKSSARQTTHGSKSPAVQNVEGNVIITIDEDKNK